MNYTKDLYDLCEIISKEIKDATRKVTEAGKLSAGDYDVLDKLTHTLKSIKTTIAMIEAEDGYSRGYPRNSYDDGSVRRYYPRERDDGMKERLRDLMNEAPESLKGDFRRLMEKM